MHVDAKDDASEVAAVVEITTTRKGTIINAMCAASIYTFKLTDCEERREKTKPNLFSRHTGIKWHAHSVSFIFGRILEVRYKVSIQAVHPDDILT